MAFISQILSSISVGNDHSYGNLRRTEVLREVLPGADFDLLDLVFSRQPWRAPSGPVLIVF